MSLSILEEKILKSAKHRLSTKVINKRFGISKEEYVVIKNRLLGKSTETTVSKITERMDLEKGEGTYTGIISDRPLSPEEIEEKYRIDKTKWKLSSFWNKEQSNGKFLVSANVSQLKIEKALEETFTEEFTNFLKSYKPKEVKCTIKDSIKKYPPVAIVLPKQDAHFNKFDIMGNNNIEERFKEIYKATEYLVFKAKAVSNVEEIFYVVGSDQFNSEWTSLTTKGTPQQNILTYEAAFTEICNHEISIIDLLITNTSKLHIKFVPGNHDQYVGWHLITWLEAYYRNHSNVVFDTSILNRKYFSYGNSAIMLNHGDTLKGRDLAHKFPIEYKDGWSNCNNYYIFTGDKHHEKSEDIHGIKHYQIPQLSKAKSYWDDKEGHTCTKAEMTGFVITKHNGMSDILKSII